MSVRSQIRDRIKAAVPTAGEVYADEAPDNPGYPHVVVTIDPQIRADLRGDGQVYAYRETVHVSLWQRVADEDETLGKALRDALVGFRLAAPSLRLGFESSARNADPSFDLVFKDLVLTVCTLA